LTEACTAAGERGWIDHFAQIQKKIKYKKYKYKYKKACTAAGEREWIGHFAPNCNKLIEIGCI